MYIISLLTHSHWHIFVLCNSERNSAIASFRERSIARVVSCFINFVSGRDREDGKSRSPWPLYRKCLRFSTEGRPNRGERSRGSQMGLTGTGKTSELKASVHGLSSRCRKSLKFSFNGPGMCTMIARLYHGAGRSTEFLAIPAFMLGVCEQVKWRDAGFFCSVMVVYRRESTSTRHAT